MSRTISQSGFSAVELLITLFIASLFVMMGYQLYSVVLNDSGDTRSRAKASNIAYKYLRQYAQSAATPCVVSTPINKQSISSEMPNASLTVAITCPNASLAAISFIQTTVFYGSPEKKVSHGVYAVK